jgi:putative transposase
LAAEKEISINSVCRQLGYSKQAYYKSIRNKQLKSCHHNIARQKVLSIRQRMPRLGVRKLYYLLKDELARECIAIGRDKLFTILRQAGLLIVRKKRYEKTTDSRHWMRKYPNLIKGQVVIRPEQVWVADITYIAMRQGHCYLHLLTDAYSKKIMGYELSSSLSASSTLKALKMGLKQRQYRNKLIHHSDRGLQYCSAAYVQQLQAAGILISMTQDGSPYDNAVAERINGILKDEFGLDDIFESFCQVQQQVKQAIMLYNQYRPHLSCSMLTPEKMHDQKKLKMKLWHKKSGKTITDPSAFLSSNLYS